jgi:hypothetical protein
VDRVRALLADDDQQRDALRAAGGLLLGVGMLEVALRRSDTFANPWADGVLLLVLLAPCVFLYGLGMLGARASDAVRGWPSAYLVFGVLLVPFVLFQFLETVGASPDASLNIAWVFLVTAGAAVAATFFARLRYGLLLAGIALTVSWMAVWDAILSDGIADEDAFRAVLLGAAALLVVAAVALRRAVPGADPTRWNELVTAAGVTVVAAPAYWLFVYYLGLSFAGLSEDPSIEPHGHWAWDAVLLVCALALIVWSWRAGSRGPAYLGAVGLALFTLSIGFDVDDSSPAGHVDGWALIVLLLGAAAFLASLVSGLRLDRLRPGAGEPTAAPPPPPPRAAPPPTPPPPGQP